MQLLSVLSVLFVPYAQSPPQRTAPGLFPNNRALDRIVDISASGEPLDALLRRIAPAGLRLTAGGEMPWERVSLYSRGKPLRDVMAGIATLLHYEWAADPEGGYKLAPTPDLRRYEQNLYLDTLERGAAGLFQAVDDLRIPADQIPTEEPKVVSVQSQRQYNLRFLTYSRPRIALGLLATLTRDQRFTLLSDGELILTQEEMNDRQRDLARGLGSEAQRAYERTKQYSEARSDAQRDWATAQYGVHLGVTTQPVNGAVGMFGFGIDGGSSVAAMFDLPAREPILPIRGTPYDYRPALRPTAHIPPAYPDLERMRLTSDVPLERGGRQLAWRGVLAELAKRVPIPTYSDDYRFVEDPQKRRLAPFNYESVPARFALAASKNLAQMSLPEALDSLCERYGYLWWYAEGALNFRSRTWFVERHYEYPPTVEEFVRTRLANKGAFDVACLDTLARLHPKQLSGLAVANLIPAPGSSMFVQSKNRFYATRYGRELWYYLQVFERLTGEQKRKVLDESGVPFRDMRPAAQQVYLRLMFRQRGGEAIAAAPNERLRATRRITENSGTNPKTVTASLGFSWHAGNAAFSGGYINFTYAPDRGER